MDSYWDLYVAYIAKCVKENKERDIDHHHYEMEWNHWLPKACFPDLPLGQYLTLKQHAIASALQTLALKENCMTGMMKKYLPEKLLELVWPYYRLARTGELHPMFGKKRPEHSEIMSERMSGELHPMFGKKRPELSKRMSGELNPMFGVRLTGELNPLYGKVRITNGSVNTQINADQPIPEGWRQGMTRFKTKENK